MIKSKNSNNSTPDKTYNHGYLTVWAYYRAYKEMAN